MIGAGVSEDYGSIAGMIFISREPMPQSKGFYRPVACKLVIYLEELYGSGMRENETLSIHNYFFVEWQLTKVLKYLGSGSFLNMLQVVMGNTATILIPKRQAAFLP